MTAVLAVGASAMFAWEDSPLSIVPASRTGLLALAGGLIALIIELRGPGAIWSLRKQLWAGPPRLMLVAGALTLVLVLISAHTNGCQCGGGANGLFELALWMALVLIVVLVSPGSAPALLAATGLGCFIAGAVALAGAHAPSEMNSGSLRLAGTYGNSNYFAATQAMGLPIAIATIVQSQRRIIRFVALAVGATLVVALVLSYSRSGLLAGAGAAATTTILLVAPRRRLVVGTAMALAGGLAVLVLYPTYAARRTEADFGGRISIARESDRSGWRRAGTGLIPHGPSRLVNAGPRVLRVTALQSGEGASVPLGDAAASVALHLRFQARAAIPLQLRFGLGDNLIASRPALATASMSRGWRTYRLTWRPSTAAADARAYFWVAVPGTFELRAPVAWSTDPRHSMRVPTRLLGPITHINQRVRRRESAYISSREGAARIALDAFLAHPLIGIGWGRFPAYASTRSGVGAIATHNEYLRFAAELGIPGLVAIVLLALAAGWAALQERSARFGPVLIGVLVAAGIELAFGNVLEAPEVILPAATATATAVALAARRRSTRATPDA